MITVKEKYSLLICRENCIIQDVRFKHGALLHISQYKEVIIILELIRKQGQSPSR